MPALHDNDVLRRFFAKSNQSSLLISASEVLKKGADSYQMEWQIIIIIIIIIKLLINNL